MLRRRTRCRNKGLIDDSCGDVKKDRTDGGDIFDGKD
jgi:hypothetical protein